jgi:hypothetical protein
MGLSYDEAYSRILNNDLPNADFINERINKEKHEIFE